MSAQDGAGTRRALHQIEPRTEPPKWKRAQCLMPQGSQGMDWWVRTFATLHTVFVGDHKHLRAQLLLELRSGERTHHASPFARCHTAVGATATAASLPAACETHVGIANGQNGKRALWTSGEALASQPHALILIPNQINKCQI
jgi:hypothetical protein